MAESRMDGLKARWDQLSERERLLFAGLGAASFLVVVAAGVLVLGNALGELREENREIRQALKDIETNRATFVRARSKTTALEARIGQGGIQLEGFLETAANQSDLLISETTERAPTQLKNSKYIQRDVDLRITKCTLDQLAKFLRRIETGANLIVVTGLHTRVRDDKHEELSVELTVSTWERAPDKAGGKKGEGGGSGGGSGGSGGGSGGGPGSTGGGSREGKG